MKADVAGRMWDSWLPWARQRERVRKEINGQISKLKKTAQEIRADHGLDILAENIEDVRAQGQAAMEEEEGSDVELEEEGEGRRRSTA